jgi:hypothetical protein
LKYLKDLAAERECDERFAQLLSLERLLLLMLRPFEPVRAHLDEHPSTMTYFNHSAYLKKTYNKKLGTP